MNTISYPSSCQGICIKSSADSGRNAAAVMLAEEINVKLAKTSVKTRRTVPEE